MLRAYRDLFPLTSSQSITKGDIDLNCTTPMLREKLVDPLSEA